MCKLCLLCNLPSVPPCLCLIYNRDIWEIAQNCKYLNPQNSWETSFKAVTNLSNCIFSLSSDFLLHLLPFLLTRSWISPPFSPPLVLRETATSQAPLSTRWLRFCGGVQVLCCKKLHGAAAEWDMSQLTICCRILIFRFRIISLHSCI